MIWPLMPFPRQRVSAQLSAPALPRPHRVHWVSAGSPTAAAAVRFALGSLMRTAAPQNLVITLRGCAAIWGLEQTRKEDCVEVRNWNFVSDVYRMEAKIIFKKVHKLLTVFLISYVFWIKRIRQSELDRSHNEECEEESHPFTSCQKTGTRAVSWFSVTAWCPHGPLKTLHMMISSLGVRLKCYRASKKCYWRVCDIIRVLFGDNAEQFIGLAF